MIHDKLRALVAEHRPLYDGRWRTPEEVARDEECERWIARLESILAEGAGDGWRDMADAPRRRPIVVVGQNFGRAGAGHHYSVAVHHNGGWVDQSADDPDDEEAELLYLVGWLDIVLPPPPGAGP